MPHRLAAAVLAAAALTGLVGCATRPEDVAAAQLQWSSLPDAVHDALGVGAAAGEAWGSIGEHWSISAPVQLDAAADPAVLGGDVTAACHAAVAALAGQDVQAYGVLPLVPGVVRATDETCARGLALGSWSRDLGSVDSPGRWVEEGQLVLGRERDGSAEMLGLALHLDERLLTTSSTAPPWTQPLAPVDPAGWDLALAAAASPLPLEAGMPAAPSTGQPSRVVLTAPAGTTLTATASCSAGRRPVEVQVASPLFTGRSSAVTMSPVDPEDPPGGADRVACGGGTATGPIHPTLRYTDTAGRRVDVALVLLSDRPVWDARMTTTVSVG